MPISERGWLGERKEIGGCLTLERRRGGWVSFGFWGVVGSLLLLERGDGLSLSPSATPIDRLDIARSLFRRRL